MRAVVRTGVERLLRWAAQRVLAATTPTIVGVTGSSGKTSTKEAIVMVLTHTLLMPVRGAEGNLNTEFGLPLAILNLPKPEGVTAWSTTAFQALRIGLDPPPAPKHVLVLEYGAEFPGDLATLVAIAQPHVAVITNVGPAHLEFFKTLDNIAREKATLILKVPATGRVVLNADDAFVDWMAQQTRAEVVRVGGEGGEFAKRAAVAVAEWFDVSASSAEAALSHWQPPAGRLVELAGVRGSVLVDDSYNANPSSMTLALNTARRLAKKRGATRLIAVLGDMLELGPEESRFHRGIALLSHKAADCTVLVGKRFQGMPADHWFLTPLDAIAFLTPSVQAGDMILVKGSEGMRMELVVAALLGDTHDQSKLVRQSPAWQAQPFRQP